MESTDNLNRCNIEEDSDPSSCDKERVEDIVEIRQKIDRIDSSIVQLLEERLESVRKVAAYKKRNGMKIFDGKREKEVLGRNISKVRNPELGRYIGIILQDIMDTSKEYQKHEIGTVNEYVNDLDFSDKKIGYTGVPGSYAYEVLINLLESSVNRKPEADNAGDLEKYCSGIMSFDSHKNLVNALHDRYIDFAILPIENSIVGEVRDSIDLINRKNIYIVGEVEHKIEHNLLGIEGSNISDIRRVFSHEQALMQCSEFLEKYPEWESLKMTNTALSGKYIHSQNNVENACIASMKTAEMYNLQILSENINNRKENYTRFFIISHIPIITEGSRKVSIITSTRNEAGALMEILKIFSDYGLNMVNLKSRPKANKTWEYYFYIDFEGSLIDRKVEEALDKVKEKSIYMQVLGNYKVYAARQH